MVADRRSALNVTVEGTVAPELFTSCSDCEVTVAGLIFSENVTVTAAPAATPCAPSAGSTDVTVGATASDGRGGSWLWSRTWIGWPPAYGSSEPSSGVSSRSVPGAGFG